jgi:hypothetical protein
MSKILYTATGAKGHSRFITLTTILISLRATISLKATHHMSIESLYIMTGKCLLQGFLSIILLLGQERDPEQHRYRSLHML